MNRHKNQDGLVAIMVASVIMVIMTLITLGFARLMQREQREATDRMLSTQAFYAAESGVNDVVAKVHDRVAPYTGSKTTCGPGASPFTNTDVSAALSSKYTCLLINPTPTSLEYSPGKINNTTSTVVPLTAVGGVSITHISIGWEPAEIPLTPAYGGSCPTNSLPQHTAWSLTPGLMRIDLTPASGGLTRDNLVNSTTSVYLYPTSCGSSAISLSSLYKGQVIPVRCGVPSSSRLCEIKFTAPGSDTRYYLRMKSYYVNSSVTVKLFRGSEVLQIADAQVQIDSTGKVADVLRRIQVRVPFNKTYPIPEFVLQSMDSICKQVSIAPPAAPSNTCAP